MTTKFSALAQADDFSDVDYRSDEACWTCPRIACLCCCCLGLPAVLMVVFVLSLNSWTTGAVQDVWQRTLGVPTSVSSVNVDIWSGRWTVHDLEVASPPEFGQADFVSLEAGVFDMNLRSLTSSPLEIEELALHNMHVYIDQTANGDSNAKRIMEHVQLMSQSEESKRIAEATMHTKLIVDRVSFHNISAKVCLHPSCDMAPPKDFLIGRVSVSNVGKATNGIYMPQLVEIIIRAVVGAAIKAAPQQLGNSLAQNLGTGLLQALDYAQIHYDLGDGLQQAGAQVSSQLGVLSQSTKQLGAGVAASLRGSEPEMIQHLDNTLGLDHPGDARTAQVRAAVNANAQAFADSAIASLQKNSGALSEGEKALGENLSAALTAAGSQLKDMFEQAPGQAAASPQSHVSAAATLGALTQGERQIAGNFSKALSSMGKLIEGNSPSGAAAQPGNPLAKAVSPTTPPEVSRQPSLQDFISPGAPQPRYL
eukprot:TRINITY_DN21818_c0_g1_i1.p1 TRINITY_DN21818_c0_g1~~TRINITY_DN21818_c0_g1_i1.p1  ORF type:complete len:480 (+),score=100.91 TRINITY_DN21818_c0_g1_i1:75-1514(+)